MQTELGPGQNLGEHQKIELQFYELWGYMRSTAFTGKRSRPVPSWATAC